MRDMEKVLVVGAGAGGLAFANLFSARCRSKGMNFEIHVFEKIGLNEGYFSNDKAAVESIYQSPSDGRNVNVTLCKRGLEVLEKAELRNQVEREGAWIEGFSQVSASSLPGGGARTVRYREPPSKPKGETSPVGAEGEQKSSRIGLLSVPRMSVIAALLRKAREDTHIFIHSGCEVVDICPENAIVWVQKNSGIQEVQGILVVAADGLWSKTRDVLFTHRTISEGALRPEGRFKSEGHQCGDRSVLCVPSKLAYREMSVRRRIPQVPGPSYLEIWQGPEMAALALPCADGRISLGIYAPKRILRRYRWDLHSLILRFLPAMAKAYTFDTSGSGGHGSGSKFEAREGSLASIYCPALSSGKVVLVGDAGHGMVPFLGQGMNSALEDALLLCEHLSSNLNSLTNRTMLSSNSIEYALRQFSDMRKPEVDLIVHQSEREAWKLTNVSSDMLKHSVGVGGEQEVPFSVFEYCNFTCLPYKECMESSFVADDKTGIPSIKVEVGDKVRRGQILGTMEVAKTFVTYRADKSGFIRRISVGACDQPEFVIEELSEDPVPTAMQGTDSTIFCMSKIMTAEQVSQENQKKTARIEHDEQDPNKSHPGHDSNLNRCCRHPEQREVESATLPPFCTDFDGELFQRHLKTKHVGRFCSLRMTTTSTMDDCMTLSIAGAPHGTLALAEVMTQGRGTKGRSWISTPRGNLYFTLLVRDAGQFGEDTKNRTQSLHFAASIATTLACRTHGVEAGIKWPNDVYVEGRKLAGILLNVEVSAANSPRTVWHLGIGVNVNESIAEGDPLRPQATSMRNHLGRKVTRETLLAEFCNQFELLYRQQLVELLHQFLALDLTCGRYVYLLPVLKGSQVEENAQNITSNATKESKSLRQTLPSGLSDTGTDLHPAGHSPLDIGMSSVCAQMRKDSTLVCNGEVVFALTVKDNGNLLVEDAEKRRREISYDDFSIRFVSSSLKMVTVYNDNKTGLDLQVDSAATTAATAVTVFSSLQVLESTPMWSPNQNKEESPTHAHILVYDDDGVGRQCLSMVLCYLTSFVDLKEYRVARISAELVKGGLWEKETALIVFPGGADIPFDRQLGEEGAQLIRSFVSNGGKYLGFCAGGYFGASHVVFDLHGPLEVNESRRLSFFDGIAVGPVFGTYDYHSEDGAGVVGVHWATKSDCDKCTSMHNTSEHCVATKVETTAAPAKPCAAENVNYTTENDPSELDVSDKATSSITVATENVNNSTSQGRVEGDVGAYPRPSRTSNWKNMLANGTKPAVVYFNGGCCFIAQSALSKSKAELLSLHCHSVTTQRGSYYCHDDVFENTRADMGATFDSDDSCLHLEEGKDKVPQRLDNEGAQTYDSHSKAGEPAVKPLEEHRWQGANRRWQPLLYYAEPDLANDLVRGWSDSTTQASRVAMAMQGIDSPPCRSRSSITNISVDRLGNNATKEANGEEDLLAAVQCFFGQGSAILCGIHPEFSPSLMEADWEAKKCGGPASESTTYSSASDDNIVELGSSACSSQDAQVSASFNSTLCSPIPRRESHLRSIIDTMKEEEDSRLELCRELLILLGIKLAAQQYRICSV